MINVIHPLTPNQKSVIVDAIKLFFFRTSNVHFVCKAAGFFLPDKITETQAHTHAVSGLWTRDDDVWSDNDDELLLP